MSTTTERLRGLAALAAALALAGCAADGPLGAARTEAPAAASGPFGFGSTPTAAELARFRSPLPDGRGLPAGQGSVAEGQALYQQRCLACHGAKLEGGIGDRLVGGRGTLPGNDPTKAPIKTVESYWPYATTLFDYVKRAMPMDAPGTLSDDQVYALSAFILSQAGIVPANTVMDARTLGAVRMPNHDGFIADPRPEHFPPPPQRAADSTAR